MIFWMGLSFFVGFWAGFFFCALFCANDEIEERKKENHE